MSREVNKLWSSSLNQFLFVCMCVLHFVSFSLSNCTSQYSMFLSLLYFFLTINLFSLSLCCLLFYASFFVYIFVFLFCVYVIMFLFLCLFTLLVNLNVILSVSPSLFLPVSLFVSFAKRRRVLMGALNIYNHWMLLANANYSL